jgi:hypothetical protein
LDTESIAHDVCQAPAVGDCIRGNYESAGKTFAARSESDSAKAVASCLVNARRKLGQREFQIEIGWILQGRYLPCKKKSSISYGGPGK